MSGKVDAGVTKRTADTLGKVITKPPLTEKLLSRPPFKYLHDIIIQVDKSSGFFRGLYSSQERDSKSIQEKDAKIQFLQKAINTLSFTTGEIVAVRPSKIVAGYEVDKTNEFLQLMASAVLKKLDSSDAVKRVLKGEDPAQVLAKGKEKEEKEKKGSVSHEKTKASESEESTTRRSQSKDRAGEDRKRSQSKERSGEGRKHSGSDTSKAKPKDSIKEEKSSSSSLKSKSHHKMSEDSDTSSRPVHRSSRKRPSASTASTIELPEDPNIERGSGSEGDEGLGSETRLDRPSSARGMRRREARPPLEPEDPNMEAAPQGQPPLGLNIAGDQAEGQSDAHATGNQSSPPPDPPMQGLVPPVQRPSSARPAPPKLVYASKKEEVNMSVPPPSHIGEAPSSVIMDTPGNVGDDDDDDDQFVVADSTSLALLPEEAFTKPIDGMMDEKPEGALTKNIVAMKEHLEGDLNRESSEGKVFLPAISEAQRRKEREMVSKEIEKLQTSIQTLCRSANPLGKIMDYVQEDIDSMQKELEMWQLENRKHNEALQKEQSITELELQPLRAQLEELEAKIVEQVDMISATKATILKNDAKTQQMLNSMAFASS